MSSKNSSESFSRERDFSQGDFCIEDMSLILKQIETHLREAGIDCIPTAGNKSPKVNTTHIIHKAESSLTGLPNSNVDATISTSKELAKNSTSKLDKQHKVISSPMLMTEDPINHILQSSEINKACPLEQLRQEVSSCTRCRLHGTRTNTVFGAGNTANPLIAFVGEGPGADEDKQGEPFVGRAGQLLTSAITSGLKVRREDVYICNVVKCRPPENRAPLPDEMEACLPFLYQQIESINPKVIVTLGKTAQQALVSSPEGITKIRGKWLQWRGYKVMPTFHPAYLLRNPPAKKLFWEDLKLVMLEVGLPL